MRKIACVVFESINSVNFNPDALTYGQYIQALASKKINKPPVPKGAVELPDDPLLDQYLYLEEIGHTWFLQRTALIEKAIVEQDYAQIMGNSVSPVAMFQKTMGSSNHSTMSSQSSRRQSWISAASSPVGLDNVNSKRIVVRSTTTAAQYTGDLLCLKKSFGLFSFLRPQELIGASSLRAVSTLIRNGDDHAEELGSELASRLDAFYSHAVAAPSPVKRRVSARARTSRDATMMAAGSAAGSNTHGITSPERHPPPAASHGANSQHHPQSDHSPVNMMSRIGSQFMGAASSVASTVKPSSEGWSITKRLFGSKPTPTPTPTPAHQQTPLLLQVMLLPMHFLPLLLHILKASPRFKWTTRAQD